MVDLCKMISTNQKDNFKGFSFIIDFIYGNFNAVEREMEDIKLNIMVKEKRKSSKSRSKEKRSKCKNESTS